MIAEPTMPKAYDPHQVEENLYDWWEQQGFFRPEQQIASGLADVTRRKPFVISHAAAQRHRRAAPGPRHHQQRRGYADPLSTACSGGPIAVGAGRGPRRHRHAERGGAPCLMRQGVSAPATWGVKSFVAEVWSLERLSITAASAPSSGVWASRATGTRERFTLDEGLSEGCAGSLRATLRRRADLPRPATW
jgi:hypothetical protein